MAMKTILIRGCLRVRSTRGSWRSWKWSWNEADALRAMMTIRQGQSVSSPNAWPWLYNGALAQSTGHRYFDAEPLYHLEHNYGHGVQNLSVVLALLMMLAFLVDQVQQLCCPLFQAAWNTMKTKRHLWEEIRHHFRTLRFDSMAELLTALV